MQNITIRIWLAILLACLLAGCASEHLATSNPDIVVSPKGLPAPDPALYDTSADYKIGSPDLLTISVFGVTDLTQDLRVDSDGNITLPLIGTVRAGGRTTVELEHDIATRLTAGYLQSPQVSVFIKEFDSQKVTVGGVVKKPGIIPLTGPTTLLQAIASAGGMDDLADHRGVVVFRQIKGQKMAAVFDVDAIGRGAVDDPPIYGNDVVMIAESGKKDAMRVFVAAAVPIYGLAHFFVAN
jgi:polysaccharide biosynthesis/export protein